MPRTNLDQDLAMQVGRACLCFNLRKASRLVTQIFDQALRPSGLKVTQFSVLMGVQSQEGPRLGRLAKRMGMDRTTLTRNLDLLAAHGLVSLEAGQDRREQRASLTPPRPARPGIRPAPLAAGPGEGGANAGTRGAGGFSLQPARALGQAGLVFLGFYVYMHLLFSRLSLGSRPTANPAQGVAP